MATSDDPYLMLYCDNVRCRVNTFENGPWGPMRGCCPGCGDVGETLT